MYVINFITFVSFDNVENLIMKVVSDAMRETNAKIENEAKSSGDWNEVKYGIKSKIEKKNIFLPEILKQRWRRQGL